MHRNDRSTRRGSVLLAVSDSIPSTSMISPNDVEVVTVKVYLSQEIILCTVYVPLDAPLLYLQSLCSYLTTLSLNPLMLAGDFNFPDIIMLVFGSCTCSKLLCDTVFDFNLAQLVQVPTDVKGNILDLVLVSNEDLILALEVHSPSNTPLQLRP